MNLPAGIERPRPDPRYIAALMVAAALLLGVGAFFRPRSAEPTTAVPTNELASLPELSQRRALRDLADFITERASSNAAAVTYLAEYQSSGLLLGPDSVLTAVVPEHPAPQVEQVRFLRLPRPAADSMGAVLLRRDADTLHFRWALVVARTANGQILSLPGMVGGRVAATCGDLRLRELIFDSAVPEAFRGGGVFDLDGNPVALAVPCSGRIMLVPLRSVARAIEQQESIAYRTWTELGFRTAPADSAAPGRPDGTGGLRVTEVRRESSAGRAGLRAGDLILSLGDQPVQSELDLSPLLLSTGESTGFTLHRTRRGVLLGLRR